MIKTFSVLINGEPKREEPKQPTAEEIAEAVAKKLKEEPKPRDEETLEEKGEDD